MQHAGPKVDTSKVTNKSRLSRRDGNAGLLGLGKAKSASGFAPNTQEKQRNQQKKREVTRVHSGLAKNKSMSTAKSAKVSNPVLPYHKAMQQKEMSSDNVKVAKAMKGAKTYLNKK